MRSELDYRNSPDPNTGTIILDKDSHCSARRAEWAAHKAGLRVTIFSYTDVLAQVKADEDPIAACARLTATEYEEQLKALFVADAPLDGQHRPHAAIALLSYPDRLDYHELDAVLSNLLGTRVGSLRSAFSELASLNLTPDYLGVNQDTLNVPTLFVPGPGDSFDPYTDNIGTPRVVDESIRRLTKFCLLVGHKKADALVVIDGQNKQLGDRLDAFFNGYFGGAPHTIADIRRVK